MMPNAAKSKNVTTSRRLLILIWTMMALVTAIAYPMQAFADEIHISTAEELLNVLDSTKTSETAGKTYVLQNDIVIDTSKLTTSFNTIKEYSSRVFSGTIDGNRCTLTLRSQDESVLNPLFDHLIGTTDNHAAIKNLSVLVDGHIQGATICTAFANVDVLNTSVTLNADVVPHDWTYQDGSPFASIATGFAGIVLNNNSESSFSGISVKSEHSIGSQSPSLRRYVLSAPLYAERELAGTRVLCNNIVISVGNVYAASKHAEQGLDPYVCAAGCIAGYQQKNGILSNVSVTVNGDIQSQSINSSATAGAFGLAHSVKGIRDCTVAVHGSISAKTADVEGARNPGDAISAGLCYQATTNNNATTSNQEGTSIHLDTGATGVLVDNDIEAVSENGNAYAYGGSHQTETSAVWKNTSIKVRSIVAKSTASGGAHAGGFSFTNSNQLDYSTWYGMDGCTIEVEKIAADASAGSATAVGFITDLSSTCTKCKVNAGAIIAKGQDAQASGFSVFFFPWTAYWVTPEDYWAIEECGVNIESIEAEATGDPSDNSNLSAAGAFILSTEPVYYKDMVASIDSSTASITSSIQARGSNPNVSLLVDENIGGFPITNNTVTLPYSKGIITNGDAIGQDAKLQFVKFTGAEPAGRGHGADDAAPNNWESGNKVILTNAPQGDKTGTLTADVFCRFDEGSKNANGEPIGTYWQLRNAAFKPDVTTRTVTYTDGVEDQEIFADQSYTVNQGDPTPAFTLNGEPADPVREGYAFAGWSPKVAETVTQDATYTATWEKNFTPPPIIKRYKIVADTQPDSAQAVAITRKGTYWYSSGSDATYTATANEGWVLVSLIVDQETLEPTSTKTMSYTFEDIREDHTITAVFKEDEEPIDPDQPTDPDTPTNPDTPTDPDTPTGPDKPDNQDTPENPSKPSKPDKPSRPGNVFSQ